MTKYNILILLLFAIVSSPVFASNDNFENLAKNYKQLNSNIATSGIISKGGVQKLKEKGFKTIIDLRTKKEGTALEEQEVIAAGMTYINIPVTGEGINPEQLAAFTKAMANISGSTLIHCGSGNRVGAIWTTYQLSKGVDVEEAFSQGRNIGMKPALEKKVRESCKKC